MLPRIFWGFSARKEICCFQLFGCISGLRNRVWNKFIWQGQGLTKCNDIFFAVMGFQHLFDNFRDIYWRKVSISNLREYLVLHRARLNIFSQNLKSVKKLSLAGAGCQRFGGKIWNTRWMPGNFRELPVFRWRSHIPKLKIPFPSEVLVSSDYRPYRNMAFYNVLAGQRSSFRNRARLNFQALRWWKKKAVTWAKKLSNRFGFC